MPEARALRQPAAIARLCEHAALLALVRGDPRRAARLLGFGEAFYASGAASREKTEMMTYARLIAELPASLAAAELANARSEGAGWSEDQAIEAAAEA